MLQCVFEFNALVQRRLTSVPDLILLSLCKHLVSFYSEFHHFKTFQTRGNVNYSARMSLSAIHCGHTAQHCKSSVHYEEECDLEKIAY